MLEPALLVVHGMHTSLQSSWGMKDMGNFGDKIVHDCSTDGFGPFAGKIVCILDCSWQGRYVYGIT